jgi:Zn-finger nucleic acid-binding protein
VSARYLIACKTCDRQWDVTHVRPGTRVRCLCEALLPVEHVTPRAPRMLRCTSCAAPLQPDASSCTFCGGAITADERRLDSLCPVCYARASSGARHCMECGVKLDPQALRAVPEGASCPRCRRDLRVRSLGEQSVIECGGCGGLFLEPQHFEHLCEQTDAQRAVLSELGNRVPPPPLTMADTGRVIYLHCPLCKDVMSRRNFGGGSGVILDFCKDHGVWLDHHELENVLDFIDHGGLKKARERELRVLHDEIERARALRHAPPSSFDFDRPARRHLGTEIDLAGVITWVAELLRKSLHR